MAKKVLTPQEEALENAQVQGENFFEKNSKMVIATIIIVFVLAAAIFGYKKAIVEPRQTKAQEMLYQAQYRKYNMHPNKRSRLLGRLLLLRCDIYYSSAFAPATWLISFIQRTEYPRARS